MTDDELSMLPVPARRFQGEPAGLATRLAASTVDAVTVGALLVGAYGGYLAARVVVSPRSFEPPNVPLAVTLVAYFTGVVLYLTACWWIVGHTAGERLMGLRVVPVAGGSLRPTRAFLRAAACVGLPAGLLWCAVDRRRRSAQDLVLRTQVVYHWLPRQRHR